MGAEQSTSGGTWNVFSNRGTMMEMKKIPSPITVQEPKSEPQCNGAASASGMESTENIEEAMTENEGMTKTTTAIEQSVQSNTTTKKNNNEGDTNTAVGELAYRPVESLDLQCVDWEGYVQKKGHLLRNWRTRYFTLEGNILSYYENKEDARQRKHLKGRCTVVDVKIDNRARTAHGNDFIFETKEGKHFHISAYSAIDRILWCHMIEAAIDFDAMKSAKPTVFSTHDFRHLKTFTTEMLYDRYRRILTDEMDLISEFIFSFNGDLVISSYYPRLMPFHGDFFGREGLVYIICTMRETFEILDYHVLSISREGTQVTVTGKEKLRCRTTGAEIEEPWTHHITLDPYGKITNLKIDINIREAKGNWSTFSSSNSFPELYSAGVRTIRTLSISLHDFTVFHVIGKGGFGTVVNAMKKSDGKIYALKILEKAQMTKYDIESSFTEMRVAQNIHHPFVAGLRIAFQSPTKLFLGMNYYSGGDLFHHMSQGATCRIAPDRAKFYTAELTLAIHHLHQHDILYRDIKPENVMIDADGHIALVDFGLAKLHVSNYQGAKTMAGSPQYTAPELLLPKDQRSYGKAADWWSLGILLYEMSVGKSPFYDQNVEKMYQKIFNDDLTFPPRPVLPDSLKDLLSGLLRKNPTERYGNKISDLLEHAYFSDINWDLLLQKKVDAPWKPQVKSALDVVYVDSEFTELNASDEVSSPNKRDSSKSFIAKNFIEKIGINKNWKSSTDIAAQDPTFKDFMYYCENPDDFVEVETLKDELRENGALSKQEGSVTPVSCCSSASPRERDSECMTPKGTPPINCLTNESRELADSRTKLRVGTPLAAFIQSGDLHSSFSLNSKESAELNDDTTVQIGLFAPLQSPPQDVVSPSSNGPIDGQGVTFEVLRRDKDSSGTSSDGNSTAEGDGTIELYADANVNNADTLIVEHLTVKDSNRDGENKEVQNSSRNIDNNEKVENAESLNK